MRRVLNAYLAHYHGERAHQGLNGQIIEPGQPVSSPPSGEVVRLTRLGGLLRLPLRFASFPSYGGLSPYGRLYCQAVA